MADLYTLGLLGQAASGAAVLLLGLLLFAVEPRRRYTVAFGAFLTGWGAFILLGNVAGLVLESSPALAQRLILLHLAFLAVTYLPLMVFALAYPATGRRWLERPWAVAALLTPAVASALVFLLDPGLFHQGFVGEGQQARSLWGPLHPVVGFTFFGALYAATYLLYHHYVTTPHAIERRRVHTVLAALLLYGAFEAAENAVLVLRPAVADGPAAVAQAPGTALAALVGLAVMGWIGLRLPMQDTGPRRHRWGLTGLAVALPALFGGLSGASLSSVGWPPLLTLGLWRLGAVALLVYGIVRFEVFGIEARTPRLLAAGGLGAVLIVGLVVIQQLLAAVLGAPAVAAVAVQIGFLGVVGYVVLRHPQVLRELLDPLTGSLAGHRTQRFDVYEAALARGSRHEPGAPDLDALRRRLDISEAEHAVLSKVQAVAGGDVGSHQPVQPGVRVDGRYWVEGELGVGGNSRVFRAHDELLDRTVVIKHLKHPGADPQRALRRFLYEARVTAAIEHPHVVDVHDFGYAGHGPYLVMEHLAGGTLEERLAEGQGHELGWILRVLDEVLDGLEHLHERGLLHRDIKPSNILLTATGTAKLADLGLAFRWDPEETQEVPGDGWAVVGTPAYMAPEVLAGGPSTPASEVYAVGAVLYEMLAGRHYLGLEGASYPEVRHRVSHADPAPLPSSVPAGLADVCRRALAKAPSKRFGSAGDMRQAVASVMGGAPGKEHVGGGEGPEGPQARGRGRGRRGGDVEPAPSRGLPDGG